MELIPLFLELASKALEEPGETSVHALGDIVLDWDIKRSLQIEIARGSRTEGRGWHNCTPTEGT